MPIQWILTFFCLAALWSAISSWRQLQIDRRKLIGWGALWLVVIFIIWRPEVTSLLAGYAGVGRGADLVVYVAIAVLFFILFRVSRKIDRLERSLTGLVRALALTEPPENNQDDRK
jgi:hypothetical protein